jgi:hypothetical protein
MKKGESQFLQIVGSSFNGAFEGWTVNFDLLSGQFNIEDNRASFKNANIVDNGDYFNVSVTAEAFTTNVGRFFIYKTNSLASTANEPSPDSGAFTVRYPNFVQASYASSPIDAPLAATTRAQDVTGGPTSDAFVDGKVRLSNTVDGYFNYVKGVAITPLLGMTFVTVPGAGNTGKYNTQVDPKWVGATLTASNGAKAVITVARNERTFGYEPIAGTTLTEIQEGFEYPNEFTIDWSTSSLTLAEVETLRNDVGDTGPFKTWPSENVTFEFDFTILSDAPNTVFHIESSDSAYDTFVGRTGNTLEFTHGNDTLAVPYANLLETGNTYAGSVTITPTELIGRVVGTAIDASMTRTDTRNVGFASRCYLGGFEGTLSSIIVGDFKVKTFIEAT